MRWSGIYITTGMQDKTKEVLRIHDIGDLANVRMELELGTIGFGDFRVLAVVQDEHAREVAKSLSQKLGLPIEGECDWHATGDPLNEVPDRLMHFPPK